LLNDFEPASGENSAPSNLIQSSILTANSAVQAAAMSSAKEQAVKRPLLQDQFGRVFDYVRIAITENCNLRCTYCMPEEGVDFASRQQILSTDEVLRVIRVLAEMGVRKVRFTGGEPLVRKDIVQLVKGAASTPGIEAVHMTTNGILFPKYAKRLREAGLTGVNISLDTMDVDKFFRITRRKGLDKVLESIQLAQELEFPRVKVNVVAMRGFNDDELDAFAALTEKQKVTVRFIEFMPFDSEQIWETGNHYLSAESMLENLKAKYPNIGLAKGTKTEHHIFQVPGWKGKIAVIPAFTRSLCGNCSRIRITADGGLRNCLYSDEEWSLFEVLRGDYDDDAVSEKFRQAYRAKAKNGFEAKKNAVAREYKVEFQGRKSMTKIGG